MCQFLVLVLCSEGRVSRCIAESGDCTGREGKPDGPVGERDLWHCFLGECEGARGGGAEPSSFSDTSAGRALGGPFGLGDARVFEAKWAQDWNFFTRSKPFIRFLGDPGVRCAARDTFISRHALLRSSPRQFCRRLDAQRVGGTPLTLKCGPVKKGQFPQADCLCGHKWIDRM